MPRFPDPRVMAVLLAGVTVSCGELWVPAGHATSTFTLECYHVGVHEDAKSGQASEIRCESCHPPGEDPQGKSTECQSCHIPDMGVDHIQTQADQPCTDCHVRPYEDGERTCTWGENVPHGADSTFPLECYHLGLHEDAETETPVQMSCESCHPADSGPTQTDPACVSCHQADQPDDHPYEPATTQVCGNCHGVVGDNGIQSCDWDGGRLNPHPDGFVDGDFHGLAMKTQDPVHEDCRGCHGDPDLVGGAAEGCDSCHTTEGIGDWRTDCTLCHGDPSVDNLGGPPADIDFVGPLPQPVADISSPAHPAHGDPSTHAEVACTDCHADYTDALDAGHIFDGTPGRAEVDMSLALAGGTWNSSGDGSCTTYCHGNGKPGNTGVVSDDAVVSTCTTCHSTGALSGAHSPRHTGDGITCGDCHHAVVTGNNNIVGPGLHVNGSVEIEFTVNMTWNPANNSCTGSSCHGSDPHSNDDWYEN